VRSLAGSRDRGAQVERLGRVEPSRAPSARGGVLTDEDAALGQQRDLRSGRWVKLEAGRGEELARVVAVEVDLEHAADVRLIVRKVVERRAVHLDRPVVAGRCQRTAGDGPQHEGHDRTHKHDRAGSLHSSPPRDLAEVAPPLRARIVPHALERNGRSD
jgi:hypothetical protein